MQHNIGRNSEQYWATVVSRDILKTEDQLKLPKAFVHHSKYKVCSVTKLLKREPIINYH